MKTFYFNSNNYTKDIIKLLNKTLPATSTNELINKSAKGIHRPMILTEKITN